MLSTRTVTPVVSRVMRTASVLGLALLAFGLAGKSLLDPPRARAIVVAAQGKATSGPVRALFVGGWVTEGGERSVAAKAAPSTWRLTVKDHSGAALLRGGLDGAEPLARQAQTDASGTKPSLLVVSSGAYDLGKAPETVAVAAEHLIDRLRVTVPQSTALLLVGPPPAVAGADPAVDAAVRDALAAAARDKQVHYADPVRDRWVASATSDPAGLTTGLSTYLVGLHLGGT